MPMVSPLLLGALALGAGEWRTETAGAFRIGPAPQPVDGVGWRQGLRIEYPAQTESRPGDHATATITVPVPPGRVYRLRLLATDTFDGPTAGYHFVQLRLDGELVWERDVAGADPGEAVLDAGRYLAGRATAELSVGVVDRKRVTNYPVVVNLVGLELSVDDGPPVSLLAPARIDWSAYPPDLPLPAAAPNLGWATTAAVVQPWGATQTVAVKDHAAWTGRWVDEFGFSAVIVLPPEAHNAIVNKQRGQDHPGSLSVAEFRAAVDDWRRRGLKVILYTSIMHCGHAPQWQYGDLTREHPEWSMRDRQGTPIRLYGHDWLCPNTGALAYTIAYTEDLIRRWDCDGVMLDNNEYLNTADGLPTCYCDSCQTSFRDYLSRRFGDEGCRQQFGVALSAARIPVSPGPLFDLWIHWRNRVWAEATEAVRAAARRVKPDVVVLANTQYQSSGWVLATDLQYPREDAVLAESRHLTPRQMVAKMQLGRAIAEGRALWNYVGTFSEQAFAELRPADEVERMMSTSLVGGANPWIVFYGFDQQPERNAAALSVVGGLGRLYRRHAAERARSAPYADVVSLVSFRDRNHLGRAVIPGHWEALSRRQVPLRTAWVDSVLHPPTGDDFRRRLAAAPRDQVVVAEHLACLSAAECAALRERAERGQVLASADCGWYDEYGRAVPESPLWRRPLPAGLIRLNTPADIVAALADRPPLVRVEPADEGWEVMAWRSGGALLVALCRHQERPTPATVAVRLPPGMATATATADTWRQDAPQPLPCRVADGVARFSISGETVLTLVVLRP